MDPETLWSERRHHRGRPPAHTREAVVATAVGVADAEGLSALTMRAVATALGTGTMSLYTYVSERDALLELMIDAVTGEQRLPEPSGDWRADVAEFAREQRALMRRHSWLPVALTGRRTLGPNALRALDHALALLVPSGLPPCEHTEVMALVSGFVAGHVAQEVARHQALGRTGDAQQFGESNARYMAAAVASGEYPYLAEAMAASAASTAGAASAADVPDADDAFERMLARVIRGLG